MIGAFLQHLFRLYQQSGTTVINITPPCKMEHRLLEHLHSTPLPSIISAEVAKDCPDLRYVQQHHFEEKQRVSLK